MATYLVNYGQTPSTALSHGKSFTNKRAAMREAANAIRELGSESWAYVFERADASGDRDRYIAKWEHGQCVVF